MNKIAIVFLIASISCNSEALTKPPVPHCTAAVLRREAEVKIRLQGSLQGSGKLQIVFSSAESKRLKRSDFDVTDTFSFDADYAIGSSEPMIPMIFLASQHKLYPTVLCRLSFVHENNSPLSEEEADGVTRSNRVADTIEK